MAWYLTDHLGTVRDLADVNGQRLAHYEYDSFGNIIRITNAAGMIDSTFADRFTYTGREFDIETGLYYYRARYYDPRTGRFVSRDPIGFVAGDANLYRYVKNRAVNASDPMGLFAVEYQTTNATKKAGKSGAIGALGQWLRCNFLKIALRLLWAYTDEGRPKLSWFSPIWRNRLVELMGKTFMVATPLYEEQEEQLRVPLLCSGMKGTEWAA